MRVTKQEFLKPDRFFPVLYLHRDDIKGILEQRGKPRSVIRQVDKLSDEEMEAIAGELGEALMGAFWDCLDVIVDEYIK